jgi:hypothetical protein
LEHTRGLANDRSEPFASWGDGVDPVNTLTGVKRHPSKSPVIERNGESVLKR